MVSDYRVMSFNIDSHIVTILMSFNGIAAKCCMFLFLITNHAHQMKGCSFSNISCHAQWRGTLIELAGYTKSHENCSVSLPLTSFVDIFFYFKPSPWPSGMSFCSSLGKGRFGHGWIVVHFDFYSFFFSSDRRVFNFD